MDVDDMQPAADDESLILGGLIRRAKELIGSAAAFFLYRETVPYTNRTRFLIYSPSEERSDGESFLMEQTSNLDILPPTDPYSLRVQLISDRLIHAAASVSQYKGISIHVPDFNWEVVTVREASLLAYCVPGGKIIINSQLLERLSTDAEIAGIIGHEVAHCIARHYAEKRTKRLGFTLLYITLLWWFPVPLLLSEMISGLLTKKMLQRLLLDLPFSRRLEKEADYIGLLIAASAGYDPREVLKTYEFLSTYDKERRMINKRKNKFSIPSYHYLSTHPSSEKRYQLIYEAMEEALSIYWESIASDNDVYTAGEIHA